MFNEEAHRAAGDGDGDAPARYEKEGRVVEVLREQVAREEKEVHSVHDCVMCATKIQMSV
jgi:hypothetical protein